MEVEKSEMYKSWYIGLKYNGGNFVTYEDEVLGEITDDMYDTYDSMYADDEYPAVKVDYDYELFNDKADTPSPFICQHN